MSDSNLQTLGNKVTLFKVPQGRATRGEPKVLVSYAGSATR